MFGTIGYMFEVGKFRVTDEHPGDVSNFVQH
jgi:hypothetical protein